MSQAPDRRDSDSERRLLAKEVARETISQTFDTLGIDIYTAQGRQDFRELMSWVRSMQTISQRSAFAVFVAVVGMVVTGAAIALWHGFKHFVGGGQ